MNLKLLSLITSLAGILLLSIILSFSKPTSINSPEDLTNLEDNQKVLIEGQVIKQTSYSILLNNNLTIKCSSSCPDYKEKKIAIEGIIENYENRIIIKALRVKILK